MGLEAVKVSYSQSQFRLRISFPASLCLTAAGLPAPFLKKALKKLESERDAGSIDFVEVRVAELNQLWKLVKSHSALVQQKDFRLVFTLAQGAPNIREIVVEAPSSDKAIYDLTFKGQVEFAKNWPFDFVRINAQHKLGRMGIDSIGNIAQLYGCWFRARRGEQIHKRQISAAPESGNDSEKGYHIIGSKARGEVSVAVTNPIVFAENGRMQALVSDCAKAVNKMQAVAGFPLDFLKEQLVDRLKGALRGPERFGLGLPAVYLVGVSAMLAGGEATGVNEAGAQGEAGGDAQKARPRGNHPGAGILDIQIADDKMRAYVGRFDKQLYDHPDFSVSLQWLQQEASVAGIVFGMSADIEAEIEARISRGDSLEDLTLATGEEPVSPEKPFLWQAFRQAQDIDQLTDINIRDAQQRSIVSLGDLVAEIRYEVAPQVGKNVFGEEVLPEHGDDLHISLGEGIEMRADGKYYATFDGVPEVTENSISISKVLVHEGDVNLRTGNIRFDGPVEIKGAIDTGSTVEVTGDLIVHGTIRDAFVRVGGNLEAKAGIVTGKRGLVRVRNDIRASFLENAKIICGGNIVVEKVILNSNIVAGGCIEANPQTGVMAGGRISARKLIRSGKLGFPKGTKTRVYAGVDWRAKVTIEIREDRLNKLLERNATDRQDLRELTRKKQKTKKHTEKIKVFQERLQKMRRIIDNLKEMVDKAKSEMSFDTDARIYVHDTLYANCELEVAGVKVPVTHDVAEVEVSSKRQRGSFIHPLVEDKDAS